MNRLIDDYIHIRSRSEAICQPLQVEDYLVQAMDDVSPPKWHLAHISWFFETFLLKPTLADYKVFDPAYEVLFNSYYHGVGAQYPRPRRGMLSRPGIEQILEYRQYIDRHMLALIDRVESEAIVFKIVLGLHHEQQHQELMLTDIKYNFASNPIYPIYQKNTESHQDKTQLNSQAELTFSDVAGGIYRIGNPQPTAKDFVFDNESPRHDVLVGDYQIANRLVTNEEFLLFIEDGGYEKPEYWLSDAWALINSVGGFKHPLYWRYSEGRWLEFTLHGMQPLKPRAPVCHVSGYEADAYARWADARLPTEQEWEIAATELVNPENAIATGNFVDTGQLQPVAADTDQPCQLFGDVWEWTSTSYSPYPGFSAFPGQLGEYNGKFMANQLVLRGGSCVTPRSHIRPGYRNFFYPKDRWQYSGIRLCRNSGV